MGFIAPVSIPTLGDVAPVASALSERSGDILRVGRDRFAMIVPFGRFTAGVTKSGIACATVCSGRCQPESWTEIFAVGLEKRERRYMPSGKLMAIILKVTEHVSLDMDAKLTFEVSDGIAPMQLHQASTLAIVDGEVQVKLSPRPVSCKPRDCWLAEQTRSQASCCGSA
jgi:hypothetical protein